MSSLPQFRNAVVKPVLLKLEKLAPDCKSILGILIVTISLEKLIDTKNKNNRTLIIPP